MKRSIFYSLTVVFVFLLQAGGNYFAGMSGFSANVVLVVVLYFGLSRGPMAGLLLGFLWGLMVDASSLGLLGLHALLYSAAGYFSGMLRRQLDEDKGWTQVIFSLMVSALYLAAYFVFEHLFSPSPRPLRWPMAAQPLINGAMAPPAFLF